MMKKQYLVAILLVFCTILTACGKSEAAKNVDNLILAIGEVSLQSEKSIFAAEDAVQALSEEDYRQVEQLHVLEEAEDAFYTLKAEGIEVSIAAIGDISIDSEEKIRAARDTYDNAENNVKEKVSNITELELAERILSELKVKNAVDLINQIGTVTLDSEPLIMAAKNAYDMLGITEKDDVENFDLLEKALSKLSDLKVDQVNTLIRGIGGVTLDSNAQIQKAMDLYRGLDSEEQKRITDYQALREAEAKVVELKLEEEKRIRKNALASMQISIDKVLGITWYKPQGFPTYINSRSHMLPYIGKDDYRSILWLRLNYAGDDWVFFDKIIFSVDGENYYKSFDYFDIIRDNKGGMVGEYIDIRPSDADIAMLRAIIESNETIVRFQGDEHYYDLIVSNSDKTAIKNVLIAYDELRR